SAEQKAARREAGKAARQAGKTREEAAADMEAAVKMTDEQKAKQKETSNHLKEVSAKADDAIGAILTEEQKKVWTEAKSKRGGGGGGDRPKGEKGKKKKNKDKDGDGA